MELVTSIPQIQNIQWKQLNKELFIYYFIFHAWLEYLRFLVLMFSLGLLVGSQNSWLPLILSRRPHLLSLSTVARQHAILAVAGNVNPRKSFEEQTSLSVLLPWPGDTGNQLGRALPFAQSPIHSTPFIECLCVPGISMSSSELLTLGVGGGGGRHSWRAFSFWRWGVC